MKTVFNNFPQAIHPSRCCAGTYKGRGEEIHTDPAVKRYPAPVASAMTRVDSKSDETREKSPLAVWKSPKHLKGMRFEIKRAPKEHGRRPKKRNIYWNPMEDFLI